LPVTGHNNYYILFSDGFATTSEEVSDGVDAPVYVISTAEEANHNFLKIWARKSGGEYIRVLPTTTVEEVNSFCFGGI